MKTAFIALAALVVVSAQARAQNLTESRAICKEREKLAVDFQGKTHDRFAEGEVTRTDVAQSDVAVLDVQLACHTIRTSTYVNEASIAAGIALNGMKAEANIGARTAAQVAAAQAKVDQVATLAQGQAQCGAKVTALEVELRKLNEQFKRGEVPRSDLSEISIQILDTKLQCGMTLIGTYCASAPAFAKQIADGMIGEARVGQRTDLDVLQTQQRELTIRSTCL